MRYSRQSFFSASTALRWLENIRERAPALDDGRSRPGVRLRVTSVSSFGFWPPGSFPAECALFDRRSNRRTRKDGSPHAAFKDAAKSSSFRRTVR